MRDDLTGLFNELIIKYKSKLKLLEQINTNEIHIRHLLKSDKTGDLLDMIQADNELFIRLDSVEFDIQSLIDKICRTAGIDRSNFNKYLSVGHEEPFIETAKIRDETNRIILALIKDRDELITEMEEK